MAGTPRVAVLYQALDPPILNGLSKPKKSGGYQYSGADFAWTLHNSGTEVITLMAKPDLGVHESWGVTHFWANTILFSGHPLQTSARLNHFEKDARVIGQSPRFVEVHEDKNLVTEIVRNSGKFTLPKAALIDSLDALHGAVSPNGALDLPIVGTPVRWSGQPRRRSMQDSRGTRESRRKVAWRIVIYQSRRVSVWTRGQRHRHATFRGVTRVLGYACRGPVQPSRGIAPYNGNAAVIANSRAVSNKEAAVDPTFGAIAEQCVQVARRLKCTAPIQIDIRMFNDDSEFALFDVNMNPDVRTKRVLQLWLPKGDEGTMLSYYVKSLAQEILYMISGG
ncbi:putative D-alanine--D-alanine ligase [Seiridium cardinale]